MLNKLIEDLQSLLHEIDVSEERTKQILGTYEDKWDDIYNNMYRYFRETDRRIFCRFLLKRFFQINTILEFEKEEINDAFQTVESVCTFIQDEKRYEFEFRNKKLLFVIPNRKYSNNSEKEKRLMTHYEITHAFFLVEYEKEDFNPYDGGTIIDCGAADGDTAILFSILYPSSHIYSFEYVEKTFEYLQRNLSYNSVENVSATRGFVYKKTGKYWMDSSFHECEKNQDGSMLVETLSIDDYVEKNEIKDVRLIKMDIEGGEIPALEGAIRTILKYKPLLYIPIYHLDSDIYTIPLFLKKLCIKMKMSFKWTEKLVWGVDGVLFVKFIDEV